MRRALLAPDDEEERGLGKKAVYRLAQLQRLAVLGRMRRATAECESTLLQYGWTTAMQQKYFACLQPSDYRKSEYARDSAGIWIPCDIYKMDFNDALGKRDAVAGNHFYGKFGIRPDIAEVAIAIISIKM